MFEFVKKNIGKHTILFFALGLIYLLSNTFLGEKSIVSSLFIISWLQFFVMIVDCHRIRNEMFPFEQKSIPEFSGQIIGGTIIFFITSIIPFIVIMLIYKKTNSVVPFGNILWYCLLFVFGYFFCIYSVHVYSSIIISNSIFYFDVELLRKMLKRENITAIIKASIIFYIVPMILKIFSTAQENELFEKIFYISVLIALYTWAYTILYMSKKMRNP